MQLGHGLIEASATAQTTGLGRNCLEEMRIRDISISEVEFGGCTSQRYGEVEANRTIKRSGI